MRRAFVPAVLLALVLAGCGDSKSGNDQAYVDALAAEMQDSESGLSIPEDNAECVANKFLDAVGGTDVLEDEGISVQEFVDSEGPADLGLEIDEDGRDTIASSFSDCDVDVVGLFLSSFDAEIPDDLRDCVDENFDDERFGEVLGDAFAAESTDAPSEDFIGFFTDLAAECPELETLS